MTTQYNEFKLGDEVTVKGVTINFKPIVGKIVDKHVTSDGNYMDECQYKVGKYWWGGSMLELVER